MREINSKKILNLTIIHKNNHIYNNLIKNNKAKILNIIKVIIK